jgi:DNA-binding transcriptional LysR family regulator
MRIDEHLGMGWSHLPRYLIERELDEGKLLSISGKHFRGGHLDLVAARRRNDAHGPIARRLWQFIADEAAELIPT